MRIYKTRWFARFARSQNIHDASLAKAVQQAERGLIDADLGSGLIKLRVARAGGGKRGGYRTLVAYRVGVRAVYLFGFAKNERDNISPDQLVELKAAAADILSRDQHVLDREVAEGRMQEVSIDEES